MRSRALVLTLGVAVLLLGVLAAVWLRPPPVPSTEPVDARPVAPTRPEAPVPPGPSAEPTAEAPVPAGPPGTEAEFQAEWADVRAAVLAHDPDALTRVRELAHRWRDLRPRPVELLEATSLEHLMSVEDAARALEARRPTP
ncbi:MAG: hypothetical protein R3F61_12845 [Myxococcota bacterium]